MHPPPGKRIPMEILVGVGLQSCAVALKRFVAFTERKRPRKIFIFLVTLSNLKKASNRAVNHTSHKMRENRCVVLQE